ncbi:angiotensin-converting enzyme-like [Anopheles cruzii]|uniref:angiotensin-converting enzyme-like n=1 Tax=Anopheles cruzii TaxID=68878 RepID=UPI0022EC2A2F|nr:angiotensin-converting enzyme-like [Anopheles cruzii]
MNAELQSLNHEAAQYAWDLSTPGHGDDSHGEEAFTLESMVQLAQRKSMWLYHSCEEGSNYRQYGWPYDRAYYLLCRGARNTHQELSEMARLSAFIQRIYTETEVCIPADCGAGNRHHQIPDGDFLSSNTFVRHPGLPVTQLNLSSVGLYTARLVTGMTKLTCFHGEPDLERLMLGGVHPCGIEEEAAILRWAWESWRMAVGPPMRQPYAKLIGLMNAGCLRGANQRDVGACWREELEIPDLRLQVHQLWQEVKPFYQKLHAVVRYFVRQRYPGEARRIDETGLVPAHLLGGMWSHSWISYGPHIIPHAVDIDRQFASANWSAADLVRRAEDIYASMGLERMSNAFWKHSLIGNATTAIKCHGTAANMFSGDDYRMIVCPANAATAVQDFYVAVHETGHIVYYMEAAAKQPTIFRDGTTAAFQEAFGDAIYLAAMTPQHLVRLGLLDSKHMAPPRSDLVGGGSGLNSFDYAFLLRMALAKVPTIPFEYLMDLYRWDLFDGSVDYRRDANGYFWYLLEHEQGIRAPPSEAGERQSARDELFDAGAGYHLSDNTPFVRYFLASFLSYQIYEGLCRSALYGTTGNTDPNANEIPMPLHRCDLYGSKKAGKSVRQALGLGASVHWTDVLEELTGKEDISAGSMLRYYAPLIELLDQFIDQHQLVVGWMAD